MNITNLLILALGLSISSFGFGAVKVKCENGKIAFPSFIGISGAKPFVELSADVYAMSLKDTRSQLTQSMSDVAGTSLCSLQAMDGKTLEATCKNGRHVHFKRAFVKGSDFFGVIMYSISLRDINNNPINAGHVLGATTCVIK